MLVCAYLVGNERKSHSEIAKIGLFGIQKLIFASTVKSQQKASSYCVSQPPGSGPVGST